MILSIDIGIQGAVILYDEIGKMLISVSEIPTYKREVKKAKGKTGIRTEYDVQRIMKLPGISTPEIADVCVMENVFPRPHDGKIQIASLMFGRGLYHGLMARYMPVRFISPQSWKGWAGLVGKEKKASVGKMEELIKSGELKVSGEIQEIPLTDGVADAVLMAMYSSQTVHAVGEEI